jgi:hypothetical protein
VIQAVQQIRPRLTAQQLERQRPAFKAVVGRSQDSLLGDAFAFDVDLVGVASAHDPVVLRPIQPRQRVGQEDRVAGDARRVADQTSIQSDDRLATRRISRQSAGLPALVL